MRRKTVSQKRPATPLALKALRRAAKNALELGNRTGTPVYVMENGKIVDLTKRGASRQKSRRTV